MSITTEKTTLQVSFPKEKLEALKFYMDEKDTTVEKELQGHIKSIYEKYVPAATRRYLDRNDPAEGLQTEVRVEAEEQAQEQAQEIIAPTPSTRGRRRNAREQNEETVDSNQLVESESADENQEQSEEQSQGMSMSM
ncbi:DUF6103 family protein [Acidaminobacter sp.]|uniref:DUF6103 family protein n=1 Tax=Acidaminobacter sp. TaxID=1872102 RepID=UPI00256E3E86|nr:DUF6103 family protein [Acidaminobacter sp.]MDK9711222.1 DUF6103 family protein [Acidaminobacter sp.]